MFAIVVHASLLQPLNACIPRDLRDRTPVQIRCAILSRQPVVSVDMWKFCRDEISDLERKRCSGLGSVLLRPRRAGRRNVVAAFALPFRRRSIDQETHPRVQQWDFKT